MKGYVLVILFLLFSSSLGEAPRTVDHGIKVLIKSETTEGLGFWKVRKLNFYLLHSIDSKKSEEFHLEDTVFPSDSEHKEINRKPMENGKDDNDIEPLGHSPGIGHGDPPGRSP
ncbi:hypothetical protein SUGI_0697880 [Cryptomeria japonica]|nr:hypothetical protein SUGI_0697880 [Cryptomeria japonica]